MITDAQIYNWARESTPDSGESNLDAVEEAGKIAGAKWVRDKQQIDLREELTREIVMNEFSKHLTKSIYFGDSTRKLIFDEISDYLTDKKEEKE
ncbi:MAG: hypothetical protein WC254_07345 [Candidatus Woesearchaeota archaeon]|jgi:hypothetical protein